MVTLDKRGRIEQNRKNRRNLRWLHSILHNGIHCLTPEHGWSPEDGFGFSSVYRLLGGRSILYWRSIPSALIGQAIVAEPKTATSRRCIHLTRRAVEALTRHQQQQHLLWEKGTTPKKRPEWVFCDAQGIPLQAANMVRQSFQLLLAKADLPHIRFHDLRHSTATLLLTLGVHPKIVQELLGHSQIFVTLDIYSHILPTLQKEAMQQFNDVLAYPSDGRSAKGWKNDYQGRKRYRDNARIHAKVGRLFTAFLSSTILDAFTKVSTSQLARIACRFGYVHSIRGRG